MARGNRSSLAKLSEHFSYDGIVGRVSIYICNYCGGKVEGGVRASHLWTRHRKLHKTFRKKE